MSVRFAPRAQQDLREIQAYVARENPDAAKRLYRAIHRTIAHIGLRPQIGIRNARAPQLRSVLVSRFPYRVHYWPRKGEVLILHIRHTARQEWGTRG